jgi:hypothetical protein
MPRRKKAETTVAPSEPKKRRRRSKAEQPAPQSEPVPAQEPPIRDPTLVEAEQLLIEKYADVNIQVGSLRAAGERSEFPGKRTVEILCGSCNRPRVLATSDLFHVRHCQDCSKAAKKASKKKEQ